MKERTKGYLSRLILALNQGVNVLVSPVANWALGLDRAPRFGDEDETMSSVLGKLRGDCGVCRAVCVVLRYLFFWQWWRGIDHCAAAIERDEGR